MPDMTPTPDNMGQGDDQMPEMPPMGDGEEMPEMPGTDSGNGDESGLDSQFDNDFDAGVEADETEDPKKYIQQLTGKLATTLRKYLETSNDSETKKFVINSLIPAAVPGLGEDDVKEIIEKVNKAKNQEPGSDDEADDSEIGEEDDTDMGDENNMPEPSEDMPMPQDDKASMPPMKEDIDFDSMLDSIEEEMCRVAQSQSKPVSTPRRKFSKFSNPRF